MFSKVWDWFNGKKTVFGLVITAVSALAAAIPAVLALFGVDAIQVAAVVGVATTIIGLLHKAYKTLYGVEHP